LKAIVDCALKKSDGVPVLIVCESREAAVEIMAKLLSELKSRMSKMPSDERIRVYGPHTAETFIQHFAERDDNLVNMKWNDIVARSTEVLKNTEARRITVTDPFGARGFDYDVKDDEANDKGGMLVIATTIPDKRNWIQLKGRTARGGE